MKPPGFWAEPCCWVRGLVAHRPRQWGPVMAGETPQRHSQPERWKWKWIVTIYILFSCCSRESGKVPAPGAPGQKQVFNVFDFSCENKCICSRVGGGHLSSQDWGKGGRSCCQSVLELSRGICVRLLQLLMAWAPCISALHRAVRHLLWRLDSIINTGIRAPCPVYEDGMGVMDMEPCEKLGEVTAIFFLAFMEAVFASPSSHTGTWIDWCCCESVGRMSQEPSGALPGGWIGMGTNGTLGLLGYRSLDAGNSFEGSLWG